MSDKELKGKFIKGNKTFTYFRPMRKRSPVGYLFVMLVNLFYTLLIRLDPPKRNQKRKYHISLCIMFKDEAPYLREWIEYHRMIGVDHFYMYDNNSSDGFEEVLAPYQEEGLITLIPWPRQHAQVDGYEDCIRQFQDESDWIGFIDVDEFLVPIEEESLAPVLDRFCHCPAVLVYWRFFGSGGMLQRAMIAAAIVTKPKLLIADEITTALDVSMQARILELLRKLNRETKMAILFISHDLHVVNRLCTKVIVMQRGKIVESGNTQEVFANPQHPYTKKLIAAIPSRRSTLRN